MELDYKRLGENVRAFRIAKRLKQKDLAEMIHMTEQHISHIECGHTKLGLPTLVAISNVLEVDCNTLLSTSLPGAEQMLLSKELESLLRSASEDIETLRLCVDLCRDVLKHRA